MTTKHTPGPWAHTNLTVHTRGTETMPALAIAQILEAGIQTEAASSPEESTANARLIAAAPDLLTASREGALTLRRWLWTLSAQRGAVADLEAVIARIESAIAKAEGRS